MLVEEVEKRTGLTWPVNGSASSGAVITIHHATTGSGPAEGFHLTVRGSAVEVQGNDDRGTLFGVGRLLRELRWDRGAAEVESPLDITSSPKYPLRGHQLGYRPKTNSYDAWTPAVCEQYIRDLAVFGTNAIELIPPRSDDAADSPHFPLPQMEMMVEMSRIARVRPRRLDLVSGDGPGLLRSARPSNPRFKEWGEVFRQLPRIDAVFVPGGDPGHTEPKYLMALLEKQTAGAASVSSQGADVGLAAELQPRVAGRVPRNPQDRQPAWLERRRLTARRSRISLPRSARAQCPRAIPSATIPTSRTAASPQYPVPGLGRGLRGHRSARGHQSAAHGRGRDLPATAARTPSASSPIRKAATTTSTRSSGAALGWDPDARTSSISCASTRATSSAERYADGFAQGLLALERNWRGPLAGQSRRRRPRSSSSRPWSAPPPRRCSPTGASSRRFTAPITTTIRAAPRHL